MAACEGIALKKLKIKLPRETIGLIETESKKGFSQLFPANMEDHVRKFGNNCSGRVTKSSAHSYGCNQQLLFKCKTGPVTPSKEKKNSVSKVVDNWSDQMEMFIADERKSESISAHSHKRECSLELDGREVKKQRISNTSIESLDCSTAHSFTSCKEKGYTKKWEKTGVESVVARVGEVGPGKWLDGQKGKTQMQECTEIIKKLMTHPFGWVFNQPVDPVKLKIPDYFSIISKPMDLGTIKYKLHKKMYLDAKGFASDVRLTFSNAMRYNPPSNDIHNMARELNNIFESLWKSLQAKWCLESSITRQKPKLIKNGSEEDVPSCLNRLPRISKSSTLRNEMRKNIVEISKGKVSSNLLDCLRRFGLIGQKEDKIQVDIDTFDDEKLSKLHRLIKPYITSKSTQSLPVKNHCGYGSTQKDLHNGGAGTSDRVSCASNSAHHGGPHNPDPPSNGTDDLEMNDLDPNSDDDGNVKFSARPATFVTTVACGEVQLGIGLEGIDYDGQMTPEKALRAAMLKRRFADTIVRAKHNTLLCNGEKGDSVKMQKEKEILEKKQQEAKLRVANEVAFRRNQEAELKMQREKEREAARIALEKMEKTVVIYENQEILKDIEMMACRKVYGCSLANPLKKLGLFLKADYIEEEEDVMKFDEDIEEGEIL